MFKILHSDYFAQSEAAEWEASTHYFAPEQFITDVASVEEGDLIYPRYRTVPFGEIMEAEVLARGGRLINTYQESARVRDLYSWVDALGDLTAPAHRLGEAAGLPEGAYFLKGETSSLKNRGPQAYLAPDHATMMKLAQELASHDWLAGQEVVIRPLRDYHWLGTSGLGLPIFHERRVFTYQGKVLADTFYWGASRKHITEPIPELTDAYYSVREEAIARVQHVAPLLVVDFAQFSHGAWEVVELNDGCQAGISDSEEHTFYRNLASSVQ